MDDIVCKYCNSPSVVKYGFVEGIQKYFCKSCRRKFSADDRLFRMRTPANQVSSALNMYYEGVSIGGICRHLLQEYGNNPSTKTVYEWINKYTSEAVRQFGDYRPNVGDTWIADETVLRIDGANVWLYDLIDEKTRFMLASRIALARTTEDAEQLMEAASRCAGKNPKVVITDRNNSYLDGIERAYGSDTEHRLGSPFTVIKGDSTSLIERFHGTLKARTKVMRGLKSVETSIQFADGFLAYYNYLRPHEKLNGSTPAEVAGVSCPLKTWADIIRNTEPRVEVLTTPEKVVVVSEQKPLVRPLVRRHYKLRKPRLRGRKSPTEVTLHIVRVERA